MVNRKQKKAKFRDFDTTALLFSDLGGKRKGVVAENKTDHTLTLALSHVTTFFKSLEATFDIRSRLSERVKFEIHECSRFSDVDVWCEQRLT